MKTNWLHKIMIVAFMIVGFWSCKIPQSPLKVARKNMPSDSYGTAKDTNNIVNINWRKYFADSNLTHLIEVALSNNQELQIVLQEIEISKNEVKARKGEYLPFVRWMAGSGVEKVGKYTRFGAVEEQLEIKDNEKFPKPLQDHLLTASVAWELDIWKKLRNAKKSATLKYLATTEGKNFMITQLIAELSNAYYELLALDNLLDIIEKNIEIQSNALRIVQQQKESAKVSQLAVNRFEAQLLNTQNLQYDIKQKITETENKIHFLTGKYEKPIQRSTSQFLNSTLDSIYATGVPSQLLNHRPDVRQAELALAAAELDVQVAKANFYPSVAIRASVGLQAFNPAYLINPESLLYGLAGDLIAPLINRNAIKATYNTANAQQIQAVYRYEQTILNAYVDVLNQMAKVENYHKSYQTKNQEVEILMQSVSIANSLFNSARADYAEVLLTQREALDARIDLLEIRMKQLNAKVNLYRALGGGWN
jgi:NodT family efflux transporter outer membrane factor (OMF) lipoprotein